MKFSLQKFSTSPTILDSAVSAGALTLATLATSTAQSDEGRCEGPDHRRQLTRKRKSCSLSQHHRPEAEATSLCMNDARFPVGGTAILPAPDFFQDPAKPGKPIPYEKALELYRGVALSQGSRYSWRNRRASNSSKAQHSEAPAAEKDFEQAKRWERIINDENRRSLGRSRSAPMRPSLARDQDRPGVFFQLGQFDEARVVLEFVKPFAADDDQKKQISLLHVTLSVCGRGFRSPARRPIPTRLRPRRRTRSSRRKP